MRRKGPWSKNSLKALVRCEACGRLLHPAMAILFERALDGKTVEDSSLVKKGFSCPDIDCLCKATGVADEVKRERGS